MTSDASSTTEQELLCSDPSKAAALRELCRQTGYSIKQENGQRKYGGPPPGWNDLIPGKGCEIFVGKLPRDLYEDELVPVLEKCGRIYELRLMMDFNGNNRGFAFVKYTTQKEAKRALKQLNNHEIRKGRLLGVCKSVDNCRLFVGGIPKTKQKQEILVEMRKLAEGVTNVIVYPAAADKTKNRGFAFVEFQDHHTAAMARRKLQHTRPQVWGHPLAVDWAEPEVEVDEDVMAQVKILYVRNLMLQTTEEQLEKEFTAIVPQEAIERVKKIRDYGFVHFSQREHAIKCMKALNGKLLDGSPMEVTLAKPVDRETYVRYTRANNRSGAEGGENQAAQQVPAFVATTFDPTLQAGAYPLTFHPGTGPIYYGQLPYTLQTANPQQQRFALPAGSALPRQIQTQGLLQTTIGAAGVPLGIPGAATGAGSRPGAVGGAAGLRSGRGRIGVNSRGYLSGRGQQYRGYQTSYFLSSLPNSSHPSSRYQEEGCSTEGRAEKYDLQPDMDLIPTSPSSLRPHLKPPAQVLEEWCQKEGFKTPSYNLHSVNGHPTGHQLFLYQVELQGSSQRCSQIKEQVSKRQQPSNSSSCSLQRNRLQFTPTKLSTSLRQARDIAAQFVTDQVALCGFDLDGGNLMSGSFDDYPQSEISDGLKLLQVDKNNLSAASMSMKVAVDSFNNDGK